MTMDDLKHAFVKAVYADHNRSKAVRSALSGILEDLSPGAVGLNVGAGRTRIDSRIKNLELEPGDGIDYVGTVDSIPVPDGSFDLVITQEVLEHVRSPASAVAEIYRVLKRGGIAYVQLPFVIGYHPCPADYWRFTDEGLSELVTSVGFDIVQTGTSVGPAVGFYRILVEFLAIFLSLPYWRLYKPAKLLMSLVCYPIKLLDPVLARSREARRISGGFFIVCRKP